MNSIPETTRWLIWSIEHNSWWRPNENGYTPHRLEAGRYTFDKAINIVTWANRFNPGKPLEAMVMDEN